MQSTQSADSKPSKVTVIVTYNGVDRQVIVQPHAAVTSLLQHAIHEFHITAQPHLLSLFRSDGTKVDEKQSVEEAGITDGTVLYLRQDVVKGG